VGMRFASRGPTPFSNNSSHLHPAQSSRYPPFTFLPFLAYGLPLSSLIVRCSSLVTKRSINR
jgi:hypothetical protein